jgi:Ca-activated chloride channel family protein
MSFAHPAVAAILLLALALAWWALRRHDQQRKAQLEGFGQAELLDRASAISSEPMRVIRQGLKLGAMTLAVLALARPQFGERPASLAQTGRDVLVLLDLSRSMNAADTDTSRLVIAKRAVLDVLAGSAGNRFGLVVFGGSAFLQLSLTADHAAFRRFLEAATTDDLANPGTDLSRALSAAATTFEHEGERGFQSVLLVSDGESVEGDIGPALKRLREAGVPVLAIGVGTLDGAPVPADTSAAPEKWHRDHIGRVVQSRLEEGDLRRAAVETNGNYVRWVPGAGAKVIDDLAILEKRTMSSRTSPERADQFQWPLSLAILMLAMEPIIGAKPRSRVRQTEREH